MATISLSEPMSNLTLADTQAWMTAIHNAFISIGLVQTADTGQLDFGTVTELVPGTNYSHGARVYELNDSLSAEFPVYIRVDFASRRISNSSAQFAAPCCGITIGFATDGASEITGIKAGPEYPYAALTSSSVTLTVNPSPFSVARKADGVLAAFLGCNCVHHTSWGATAMAFSIERTANESGELTGDGVAFSYGGNANISIRPGITTRYIGRGYAQPGVPIKSCSIIGGVTAVGSVDGLVMSQPMWCLTPSGLKMLRELVASPHALVGGGGQVINLSIDDVTERKFISTPIAPSAASSNPQLTIVADENHRFDYCISLGWE